METCRTPGTAQVQVVHLILELQVYFKQKEEFKDDENFCRNDMDTVGIRAGCTLILYSDSSFNGNSVRIDSYATNDRYLIVLRHRSFM